MLANRCGNDASTLALSLAQDNVTHYIAIAVVEVRDGLVKKYEAEGLAQGSDECNTLLLAVGHLVDTRVELVAYAQLLEPFSDGAKGLCAGDIILDLYIFYCSKLAKELEILK